MPMAQELHGAELLWESCFPNKNNECLALGGDILGDESYFCLPSVVGARLDGWGWGGGRKACRFQHGGQLKVA